MQLVDISKTKYIWKERESAGECFNTSEVDPWTHQWVFCLDLSEDILLVMLMGMRIKICKE